MPRGVLLCLADGDMLSAPQLALQIYSCLCCLRTELRPGVQDRALVRESKVCIPRHCTQTDWLYQLLCV